MAGTAAQQVSTIADKGGDWTKMQQYAAEAKGASDRAQTIAAKYPNDTIVQHNASRAKDISDLAQELVARVKARDKTMEAIIRNM